MTATWIKRGVFASLGAGAGFAYYYFVGCASGTCPITSNPYISTAYGAVVGALLAPRKPVQG
jgi:phage shock protein E